eukprot:jgi/Tetstr1/424128/TSEL_014737.t1
MAAAVPPAYSERRTSTTSSARYTSNANLWLAAVGELGGAAPAMEVAGASAAEVAPAAALEAGENRSRIKSGQI